MPKTTLQTLPAELRNNIYELVFASDEEEPVDICKAAPPAKDILLTCKQVYNEAAGMYRAKYRSYWSSTSFQLDDSIEITAADKHHFMGLDIEDVEHITNFLVIDDQNTYSLQDGGWTAVRKHGDGPDRWYMW